MSRNLRSGAPDCTASVIEESVIRIRTGKLLTSFDTSAPVAVVLKVIFLLLTKSEGRIAFLLVVMVYLLVAIPSPAVTNPIIVDVTVPDLVSKLNGIDKVDFSKVGEYGRVASGGSLNKLRDEIVENIVYFEKTTFQDFIGEYREVYLDEYRQWLKANLK